MTESSHDEDRRPYQKSLVSELRSHVETLAEDLLVRATEDATVDAGLRGAFQGMQSGGRTAQHFEDWREDYLDQVAVAWVLACVFVRFLEDEGLVPEVWLAGEGERAKIAEGTHELYFRSHPHESDREYLQHVFREVGKIPAAAELFATGKTPLWAVAVSGDAAMRLLNFWREVDPSTGKLLRSFRTAGGDTRFLGDLYQDLSEKARKKYALLQTPVFVEEFILDRTLTPALDEFGLAEVRLIDPTCGSGHFLLGAFERLFKLWTKVESNDRVAAQKALDGVWGVDINPFAVAITRFRLIVAAVQACALKNLREAPGWILHLAVGDSLLFGSRPSFGGKRDPLDQQGELFEVNPLYAVEDRPALNAVLRQGYHVVVGNPPYITAKDKAQNVAYRRLYSTCHRKFSLGVPFTQRFWDFAIQSGEEDCGVGYIGMLTANSFMKREFGKKLIEQFLPKVDLTHVLDTSGAYLPGCGTPTVILFGRGRRPIANTVRAVLGISGIPPEGGDPSQGSVWQSIVRQVDCPNSTSRFTSSSDVLRESFASHPWSMGGGGIAELKEQLDEDLDAKLRHFVSSIGFGVILGEDDAFFVPMECRLRTGLEGGRFRPIVEGDQIRDWRVDCPNSVVYPYDQELVLINDESILRYLWSVRCVLEGRADFSSQTYKQAGRPFWEYHQMPPGKGLIPRSITFSFVATHNHFVLDRGGKVYKQSAPIIKLPAGATEDEHLALVGLLNSSTACFWMKQSFHNKGSTVDQHGARQRTAAFEDFYEYTGTGLLRFPITAQKPLHLSRSLDECGQGVTRLSPDSIVAGSTPTAAILEDARLRFGSIRAQMIALQEELDWQCYRLYGLLADDLCHPQEEVPEVALGERAFEIVMARKMATGELQTAWFERHGSTPVVEIPARWPEGYRRLVQRRIELIESNKEIGLIEKPEYKRRWNTEPWEEQEQRALKNWLLDRLESEPYRPRAELQSTARLADRAAADAEFMQVASLYRKRADFEVSTLVAELVEGEAVPFLPILRYKPSGLRKRELWERTWGLQRQEDAGQEVGPIPPPPKYASADFLKTDFWRLRGKLDVPKERWISYAHLSTDGALLVGWAGWNHLEQAEAIVAHYDARRRDGWDAPRLAPLLAGLRDLLPWIRQWHPEVNPEYGETAADSYQTLLEHDAHELGLTQEDLRDWKPPAAPARGRGKKKG